MKTTEQGSVQLWALVISSVGLVIFTCLMLKQSHHTRLDPTGSMAIPNHQPAIPLARTPSQPGLSLVPAYTISGAIRGRPVLHHELPAYPAWAEEEGASGRVRLAFRVSDAGEVYPNIWVTQTVGRPEFETLAINALKHWKFAPVQTARNTVEPSDLYSEPYPGQAGTINFTFNLTNHPIRL